MSQVQGQEPREIQELLPGAFEQMDPIPSLPGYNQCKHQHSTGLGLALTCFLWAPPKVPRARQQWDGVLGKHRGSGLSKPQKISFFKLYK